MSHVLKIEATISSYSGGILRYDFVINPIVKESGVFRFMRYTMEEERDKKNKNNSRKLIAYDLRKKHRACWERYHRWADEA